jgi:hypothetical protein
MAWTHPIPILSEMLDHETRALFCDPDAEVRQAAVTELKSLGAKK